ncbi:NAD(P)H nitroreductase [Amycolatopsis balhimycina DSM 5908]|uniref:NAD(P)H nitroreductase n=1 Tax=Amycolatopsis balhimycina DSM 5908 TaxID=1081091 RepID=A0A428W4Y5_AMYBA|nr:NAD(P)H nitroreductase [Amycolatopsis balhimycina]RSM38103.1 NAD(P)H nitroreductase [Amycolatopsis balhimycina DSM 5908]
MERGFPDDYTVKTAVAMAVRAPSVHNSQPWNWRIGHSSLHLYADPDRQLRETDPDGRDLILSCGAALHHLRIAFAALGWAAEVHRLPNPDEPDHLAAITLQQHEPSQDEVAMAAAIPRRRTDRRRHSSWNVPRGHVEAMAKAAALEGTVLQVAENSARYHLATAVEEASRRHETDPAYRTELAAWSGRHISPDGVPARNTPAPDDTPGALRTRPFTDPLLTQPPDAKAEDDETVLLVLSTASDDRMSRLRAGEATSAALLTATAFGLSACPLTEPLELPEVRDTVTERVTGGSFPQMVLRIGWAPANADPLTATPRRALADVLQPLEAPPKHFQAH